MNQSEIDRLVYQSERIAVALINDVGVPSDLRKAYVLYHRSHHDFTTLLGLGVVLVCRDWAFTTIARGVVDPEAFVPSDMFAVVVMLEGYGCLIHFEAPAPATATAITSPGGCA